MQTHRDPRTLTVIIVLHPFVGETSIHVEAERGDQSYTIADDWAPGPDSEIPQLLARLTRLWLEVGPLAATLAFRAPQRRRFGG